MTIHIHGTIVTQYGVAANNRGENEGNLTTLQKILWKGEVHTSVSAEAIRFALRYWWQRKYDETGEELYRVNRRWDDDKLDFVIENQSFSAEMYIDDDVMGFMEAKAAQAEKEAEAEGETKSRGSRGKGTTNARRGALEVSRAVSLYPFFGEVSFNAKAGQKGRTSLYQTEMHATSYQYSFSFTPSQLCRPERAKAVLEAIGSLSGVGGNQGRFLYDFSPLAAVFRVTHDPAPRILYVFEQEVGQPLQMRELVRRVEAGDVPADELVIGGAIAAAGEAGILREKGAHVCAGIKETIAAVQARIG
ncbi:type I-B CRISPR-associated protein Cas7/Cst2/DevR [Bacillaceae bacterium]